MTCIALSLKPYEIIIILIWPAGTIAYSVLDAYVLLCNSYHIVCSPVASEGQESGCGFAGCAQSRVSQR